MKRLLASVVIVAVSGCATTPSGIEREPIVATYQSQKAPLDIARCLQGQNPDLDIDLRQGDTVSVSNRNQFGSILLNWRIAKTATGSAIEFRKTNAIAPGQEKAERCF